MKAVGESDEHRKTYKEAFQKAIPYLLETSATDSVLRRISTKP
jgi:hypothetical protein